MFHEVSTGRLRLSYPTETNCTALNRPASLLSLGAEAMEAEKENRFDRALHVAPCVSARKVLLAQSLLDNNRCLNQARTKRRLSEPQAMVLTVSAR